MTERNAATIAGTHAPNITDPWVARYPDAAAPITSLATVVEPAIQLEHECRYPGGRVGNGVVALFWSSVDMSYLVESQLRRSTVR